MAFRIAGIDPAQFQPLFALDDAALAARRATRVRATSQPGFPCRVSLVDAEPGEELLLTEFVNHDVETPYRSSFAIYVRGGAERAEFHNQLPPVLLGRPIALRGFDANGWLKAARLCMPGTAEEMIVELFAIPEIAYLHAHNAAHGCFAARVDRA